MFQCIFQSFFYLSNNNSSGINLLFKDEQTDCCNTTVYIYNNNDILYYQICRVGLFLILFFLHHHDQTLTCNIALHVPLTILSEDVPRGKARRGARATSRLDANHWRLSPPAALLPFRLAIPVGSPSMLRLALPLPAVQRAHGAKGTGYKVSYHIRTGDCFESVLDLDPHIRGERSNGSCNGMAV